MATAVEKPNFVFPDKFHKPLFAAQISLRVLAFVACLAASSITLANNQTATAFGVVAHARYNYSPSFEFFAYANLVVCVFTILSLVLAVNMAKRVAVDPALYFYMFVHDLMMTVVLMAACAAVTAVGYIGKYGNSHAGWMPICAYLEKFCQRATAASVLAYFGFLFYLILALVSAHRSRHITL
ncbi:CASP-like protein 1F2 [Andrographis paniculata]|uniref:CASP-like protein 1F2 n=1 Tax=Andrographis paniculata TaxID=175694 RepID=UPI0021E9338D|nr:CASP-like protein 1F2 [Andrographis paniculata]